MNVRLLSVKPILTSSDPHPPPPAPHTTNTPRLSTAGAEREGRGDNGFRGKIGHIDASLRRHAGMLFFLWAYAVCIKKPHPSLQIPHSVLHNHPKLCIKPNLHSQGCRAPSVYRLGEPAEDGQAENEALLEC